MVEIGKCYNVNLPYKHMHSSLKTGDIVKVLSKNNKNENPWVMNIVTGQEQFCQEEALAEEVTMEDILKDDSPLDSQVGGDHYKKYGDYQPWVVCSKWLSKEELKGLMKGTAIIYLAREQDKGGRSDIKKALHTMQLYLALTENE
jgi:hypothetical protein